MRKTKKMPTNGRVAVVHERYLEAVKGSSGWVIVGGRNDPPPPDPNDPTNPNEV